MDLLCTIPGVGRQTSLAIMTELLISGKLSQLLAFAGLAPYNRDIGSKCGKLFIRTGRTSLKKILYMAAVASLRCNKRLMQFYKLLKDNGKPSKMAIIAVARKLLKITIAIRENKIPYDEKFA